MTSGSTTRPPAPRRGEHESRAEQHEPPLTAIRSRLDVPGWIELSASVMDAVTASPLPTAARASSPAVHVRRRSCAADGLPRRLAADAAVAGRRLPVPLPGLGAHTAQRRRDRQDHDHSFAASWPGCRPSPVNRPLSGIATAFAGVVLQWPANSSDGTHPLARQPRRRANLDRRRHRLGGSMPTAPCRSTCAYGAQQRHGLDGP